MVTELASEQLHIVTNTVEMLRVARGVVDTEALDGFYEETERTNIAILSGKIGVALATGPRDGPMVDSALNVYPDDFRRAKLDRLKSGLYVPRTTDKQARKKRVVHVGCAEADLVVKGAVSRYMGVVVGNKEFKTIASSPADFAAHIMATTLDAHDNDRIREEADATAERSVAHALDKKIETMDALDSSLTSEVAVLRSLYRDARFPWRTAFRSKTLNVRRKEGEELIHDTIEIAGRTLGYGTTVIEASHLAWTSNMDRMPTAADRGDAWRKIAEFSGRWRNAKRVKINQSIKGCYVERLKYVAAEPIAEEHKELYARHIKSLQAS